MKLLLLHLVGFLYYFTYIDDPRQIQIKFADDVFQIYAKLWTQTIKVIRQQVIQ
jgi:hypothetical protein